MSDIYADGSGWNGKESRWCVHTSDGINHMSSVPYELSNNVCEYNAVLSAISHAGTKDTIYTDSMLVVKQVAGEYKCKAKHLQHSVIVVRVGLEVKKLQLKWISRKQNLAGKVFE
jgi:ribonuclease HI